MIMADRRTVDKILPVGIGSTQSRVCIAVFTESAFDESSVFVAVENIYGLFLPAYIHASGIRYRWFLTAMSLLCCNDNDAIGSTGTIDSCRGSIFQNVETFNVLGINR